MEDIAPDAVPLGAGLTLVRCAQGELCSQHRLTEAAPYCARQRRVPPEKWRSAVSSKRLFGRLSAPLADHL
jgi:hypothetical protein